MSVRDPIKLSGVPGSPYTRKMLAVLRYRRIPYRLLLNGGSVPGMPQPKVRLLPTFYLPGPDGSLEAVVDSTPIIRRLEEEYSGRTIIPNDPAVRFLDELVEDYADEWLTKAMFHYRWAYAADIKRATQVLPCYSGFPISDSSLASASKFVGERQVSRLYVVGSNAVTGPVIESSYRRFLEIFEAHLREHHFWMGKRPGSADFAVFGQLTQLAQFDPTPMALTFDIAPRVEAWVSLMEDRSGFEPAEDDWFSIDGLPPTFTALLREIGRVYQPVMLANAKALRTGADRVETEVDGQLWSQPAFPYQAKCLQWIRASHDALPAPAKIRVDALMSANGCDALFA